jgi:hypothetical protein
MKRATTFFGLLLLSSCLFYSTPSRADEDALPDAVITQVNTPLAKVGQGIFHKFGFRIYRATLWAPDGKWEAQKPYALQLSYFRSLSKDTLIDTVMSDIESQGGSDEATYERWKNVLENSLSDIREGDVLIGLSVPDEKTKLFYNGAVIANIDEQPFADAFFNVWLGDHADERLRTEILGK